MEIGNGSGNIVATNQTFHSIAITLSIKSLIRARAKDQHK